MSDLLKSFDSWLTGTDPQALVIREHLVPVDGTDGVVFPATYAASKDGKFKGGYNIDTFSDGRNVCLIDSVGSQANRIEPIFADEKYRHLVPQVVVKAGEKHVNLLVDAGHRAGDAVVRCSELQAPLQAAFRAILDRGDAEPLAKLAPTSLVFGVWDSRDTQAKLPRLFASAIRAFNVRELSRSAQYVPAVEYVESGVLPEPTKAELDAYSERGFRHVPATGTHGGIIADGGIRRDATLSLAALRLLSAGKDAAKTLALRRYILGLALVAFTHPPSGYLRQGCLLVLDAEKPREFVEVRADGRRTASPVTHDNGLAYANAAAAKFGVGANQTVEFDAERAKADVTGTPTNTAKAKSKKGGKKGDAKSDSGGE